MEDLDDNCYLTEEKKIIPFKPEEKIKEFSVQYYHYRRYFPRMDGLDWRKLKLTNIGEYSIIQKKSADEVLNEIDRRFGETTDITVTDATGGMGGLAIYLAPHLKKIKLVEVVSQHARIIQGNMKVYNITNYQVYRRDYLEIMNRLTQDVVFFDPPWGGRGYSKNKQLSLGLNNVNIACICNHLIENGRVKMIIIFAPKNFDLERFDTLVHFQYQVKNLGKHKLVVI